MKIQIVAAIIKKQDQFLLGKRSFKEKGAAGYWCPISGKIEIGESETQAIEREVFEEVGLKVTALRKVDEFDNNEGTGRLHWWLVDIVEGEPFLKNDEHTEIRWLTVSEMYQLDYIYPEDIELFKSLL